MPPRHDVIVVGAGHAGIEAAHSAARLGCTVGLCTLSRDTVGQMPCNPAVGGTAKGHLVREIDALGGLMGEAIDATAIQFKLLNRSRGPAVQSPRAQADKRRYGDWMRSRLDREPNVDWIVGRVGSVIVEGGRAAGVELEDGARIGGIYRMLGQNQTKIDSTEAGEIVGLGRLESVATGDTIAPADGAGIEPLARAGIPPAVYACAVRAAKREDEVKVSGAMGRLAQEDPSLRFEQNPDTREAVLHGQGEMHLKVALDRLAGKYGLKLQTGRPKVAYKEAIRKAVSQHARYKKQTGGHGQFGDVHIDVKPLPRGSGFAFQNTVVGGAIPRQYIPAVAAGVRDYLGSGPLGFPVVDLSVTLTDGKHHAVDSSEQAFKTAGRMAMAEALPKCDPVLLEPICEVKISVPNEFTPNVQRLVTGRRGQVLGFSAREDWPGWDEITSQMPQSEMHDLIVELRSLTLGVGTFESRFDRLQELTGRLAEGVLAAAKGA